MIDFFGPGFDAAETIGLLPRLRELAYNVTELNYVDRSGRPRAEEVTAALTDGTRWSAIS